VQAGGLHRGHLAAGQDVDAALVTGEPGLGCADASPWRLGQMARGGVSVVKGDRRFGDAEQRGAASSRGIPLVDHIEVEDRYIRIMGCGEARWPRRSARAGDGSGWCETWGLRVLLCRAIVPRGGKQQKGRRLISQAKRDPKKQGRSEGVRLKHQVPLNHTSSADIVRTDNTVVATIAVDARCTKTLYCCATTNTRAPTGSAANMTAASDHSLGIGTT
jgi:hypothetical protein